tara:strand:+ start:369 stop:731 length:363 start_codon:yes stop_codon:yes gene_type:complete
MDKESKIELQKIDCNCSDCKFMIRNSDKFKESIEDHHRWQLDYFNKLRDNLYNKAKEWGKRGFPDKAINVKKEADKMRFQFDKKEASINYGRCHKLNKDVSFIPNVCQLETQECFEHRRA